MQTISIHDVASIELSQTTSFKKSAKHRAFNVVSFEVIDTHGNRIMLELFSDDVNALIINQTNKGE